MQIELFEVSCSNCHKQIAVTATLINVFCPHCQPEKHRQAMNRRRSRFKIRARRAA